MPLLLRILSFSSFSHYCSNPLNSSIRLLPLSKTQIKKLSRLSVSTPKPFWTMGNKDEALLVPEVNYNDRNQPRPQPWTRGNIALTIALFSTATGIILLGACLAVHSCSGAPEDTTMTPVTFTLTPDAAHWKKQGEENAARDLPLFDDIAANLASGSGDHTLLSEQLTLLQTTIRDVGDNNRILIPKIIDVITKINSFLEADSPSVLSKLGLKALIWFVDGKRDNKSYYLLDGVQQWNTLRIKILRKYLSGDVTSKLIQDLGGMEKESGDLRDELDAMAQIFVKGIKRIHTLSEDIGGNLAELKSIAKHLLEVSAQKDTFLDRNKALEDSADKLAKEWK